jgi:methylglutamate dehydrogenase subunit C
MSGFRLPPAASSSATCRSPSPSTARPVAGCQGDTLASALIANGVSLMGRSFKYHRPRGTHDGGRRRAQRADGDRRRRAPGAQCARDRPGALRRAGGQSQHRWPSLEHDIGALNSLAASVFVAGFYYKTFMWPKSFWEKVYEPIIRRAAGLGRATYEPDPDRYEKAYATATCW